MFILLLVRIFLTEIHVLSTVALEMWGPVRKVLAAQA